MAKYWRLLALVVVMTASAGCVRDLQVYNVDAHPIPQAAQSLSMTEIKSVIMLAGADRGWTFEEVGPGEIAATLLVRRHTARVNIQYSQTNYSIRYKDSVNLRYTGSTIHRNYNKWIMKLEQDIEGDLQRRGLQSG